MDYKYINIDKIRIGNININDDKKIIIPILYDNSKLSIKIPEKKNKYFEIERLENGVFNYYLTLELMENFDEFEEEYKNNPEKISNQLESIKFSNFIMELKSKIKECFFNELKINNNYLNIEYNNLNLENHEIDEAIWDDNIDFSYIYEVNNIKDNEENQEISLRHRFHLNKITKKEKDFILECNIIFINIKVDNKKHIYIDWNI